MRRHRLTFFTSFSGRISTLYLVLSIGLCALCGWVTVTQFRHFFSEVEQKLNRDLAAKLGHLVQEPLAAGAYGEALTRADAQTTMFFPSLELYILDADGNILARSSADATLARDRVDVAPIQRLADPHAMLPVWGDDPTQPDVQKVFSATAVDLAGGEPGYLYVILRGKAAASAEDMLKNSYILRAVPTYLLLALGFSVVVGLLLFGLLTKRFRRLTTTVRRLKAGDFGQRATVHRHDEIGELSRAFNEMADTIQAQVKVLRETDHRRRELVANVSHDFRTPLTSIRGHAERLLSRGRECLNDDQLEDIEAIEKNATRLENLANHLHELSNLDARTIEPHMEPFDLAELVQDVIIKFSPQAESLGIVLKAEIEPGLPQVVGAIGLVDRLLSNLVENALDNTPPGGEVRLTFEVAEERVSVHVRDTGRGIPEEALRLVTQRFYQVKRPGLRDEERSGLGLSIAQEIAELHGHSLELESKEGAGTRVTFCLPRRGKEDVAARKTLAGRVAG